MRWSHALLRNARRIYSAGRWLPVCAIAALLTVSSSIRAQELQIDRTGEITVNDSAEPISVTTEEMDSGSQVAAPAPATRYLLASSARCPVAGCQVENAVIAYDLNTGVYKGVHIPNVLGPYGMALHPKTGRLLLAIRDEHRIAEFDARTGAFIRIFIPAGSGGLHNPQNMLFTNSNTLLVTSTPSLGTTGKINGVIEYNADTGAFVRVFANGGNINPAFPEDCSYASPTASCIRGANGMAMGTNGNIYVASGINNAVIEFNGSTGAYVGRFVSPYLIEPIGLVLRTGTTRPGNLLVTTTWYDPNVQGDGEKVMEFDKTTRTLYPQFPILANGLIAPGAMRFNAAGNLLVMEFIGSISTITPDRIVIRHGTNGAHLGVFNRNETNTNTDTHLHGPTAMAEIAYGQAVGDADADADRDLKDYASMQRCLSPVTTACRTAFDDDLNGILVANDWQAFVAGLVGPKLTCTSAAQCNDANPCTTDTCSAGNCIHTNVPNGTSCADSSFCDGAEVCTHGICDAQAPCVDAAHCSESLDICVACVTNAECNDSNPCTLDICVGGATGCTHSPQSGSCNDGNACTLVDFCSGGVCQGGSPRNCNDNNPCTADSCTPATGCTYNFNNFLPCNDNNVCTYNDFCLSGVCNGGDPIDCSDGDICTDDVCVNPFGCQHPNNTNLCDDGNDCTGPDHCSGGDCVSTPLNCDDGIDCTIDTCVDGQCVNTPNHPSCNDGFFCNGTEVCNALVGCQSPGNPCTSGAECANVCNEAADNCFVAAGTACTADGNPCTNDVCNGSGACGVNNTAPCTDNSACTVNDVCANGVCQPGTALTCNDNKPCTDDTCNPASGCVFTPDTGNSCSDGNACNGAEVCIADGNCQAGTPLTCNDNNPCTDDSCSAAMGCVYTPDASNSCADSNVCNGAETCSAAGACVAGTPLSCDDGKPCTDDTCTPSTGCANTPDTNNSCSDTNACNGAEVCLADGNCQAGTPLVCNDNEPCTDDSCDPATGCVFVNDDGNSCEDGNLCNGAEVCTGGDCLPGTPLNCDDGEFCTEDGCDAQLGCTYTDKTGPCEDGDACTSGDVCDLGECISGPPTDCDDNEICTDDSCDPELGCIHTDNMAACNDANACTEDDTCELGECGGTPVNCSDNNACTADGCNPQTGCTYTPLNNTDCDDGDPCTRNDRCENGVCQGNPIPNCQACADHPECDDSDVCDGLEACVDGICAEGTPLTCADTNPCTDDLCDPGSGCFFPHNSLACDDGDECTTGDACAGGSCVPGAPLDCDDGNGCTDDSCNPASGCVYVNNTLTCDDSEFCTVSDTCLNGSCVGQPRDCGDNNVCTEDFCNEDLDMCTYVNNANSCDDGDACTEGDFCTGGSCTGGPAVDCDDSDVCTDDSCDPQTGCQHAFNTAPCDDGDECTEGDTCLSGICESGGPVDCNDLNDCTDDSCNPSVGCEYANNANPCDDGDECTENDICGGGSCQPGSVIDCDDGEACTQDSCDPATGCEYVDLTGPCEDGNACTEGDICSGGTCVSGGPVDCDDLNDCTDDSCNPAIGCEYADNADPCEDGSECTVGDICAVGDCQPGPVDCDDGNICTDDSCVSGQCINSANSAPCDDENLCTDGDQCSGGMCAGTPVECPGPANECDGGQSCNMTTGTCEDLPDAVSGSACEADGNLCTDDECDGFGMCLTVNTVTCPGPVNECDGGTTCNSSTGLCEDSPDAVSGTACEADADLCTIDECDGAGACVNVGDVPCEGGEVCNPKTGACPEP